MLAWIKTRSGKVVSEELLPIQDSLCTIDICYPGAGYQYDILCWHKLALRRHNISAIFRCILHRKLSNGARQTRMTIRALVVLRLNTSTSSTVALSDSPRGILYLEQRLRAKVYHQARSQRSVGSNALSKVRPPRSETTCKLWQIYVDFRVQTSHMASYNLGCTLFSFASPLVF